MRSLLISLAAPILAFASAIPSDLVRRTSVPLRIQPLGDSITKGNGSPDQNGYRLKLANLLKGTDVDFIGSLKSGTMADNDHEGHSGQYIGDMAGYSTLSSNAMPNVVTLMAGTNDMDKEVELSTAPDRMSSLLDVLYNNNPQATILLAKVIWANDARMQANTDAFNAKLDGIVAAKVKAGTKVMIVDMSKIITASDLSDRKHPNDSGYAKMAKAWYDGINAAVKKGWIVKPQTPKQTSGVGIGTGNNAAASGTCKGDNWKGKVTIFKDQIRTWESLGVVAPGVSGGSKDKLHLADLDGDGRVDYMQVEADLTINAWLNTGKITGSGDNSGAWKNIGAIGPTFKSLEKLLPFFADIDNDGRADLIMVYPDTSAKVWRNVIKDGKPSFVSFDASWATGVKDVAKQEWVRFADMDGDGYADYVIIGDKGDLKYARNTHNNNGKSTTAVNWEPVRTIAPGANGATRGQVRLHDMNGDGRADYVLIDAAGSVTVFENTGNLMKDTSKISWANKGVVAPGVEGFPGDMVTFGDLNGDKIPDFLGVSSNGAITGYLNNGITDRGASIRFADLNGDGMPEIISVGPGGRARAWQNIQGASSFAPLGLISNGVADKPSPSEVQFVDVNGDGLADYTLISANSAVKAWLNLGKIGNTNGERLWSDPITISAGVGVSGTQIKFADLDGDARPEFIVVGDGGAAEAYFNLGHIPPKSGERIWRDKQVIATGVGAPGPRIRFADLNGDGKAEYLVVWDGGSVEAYNNTGNFPDGSGDKWEYIGVIASGVADQAPVRVVDINGGPC